MVRSKSGKLTRFFSVSDFCRGFAIILVSLGYLQAVGNIIVLATSTQSSGCLKSAYHDQKWHGTGFQQNLRQSCLTNLKK